VPPPIASIDIGTNSVLLLVAQESRDGRLLSVEQHCEITRLGEGVDASGELQSAATHRTLTAIVDFAERARELGVERLQIVGTSALRDARNGAHFLAQIQQRVGEDVAIISGQREAELVLAGVQTSFGKLPSGSVVFDVGGGSTELIAMDDAGVALESLDVGAVRLTERFITHDPPTSVELQAVKDAVRISLASLASESIATYRHPPLLIGVSGTVTTLYAVENRLARYEASRVDGRTLTRVQVLELVSRLAALCLDKRRKLPGLDPRRADVIIAGALIVTEVMHFVGAQELRVADRGVRWGLLAGG